jgi:hypothetical protein
MANLKHIHVLKITEYAAALALIFAPEKVAQYYRKLGIDFDAESVGNTIDTAVSHSPEAEALDDIKNSVHNPAVRAALKRELGM